MNHLPNLITDLGLILIIAGITTLLFRGLKQPLVLGYILAGFLVSPNFAIFPTVTDVGDIRIWADIGVIFLLFTLGLEFSFKKLLNIGGTAAVTSFTEVSAMLVLGFVLGQVLGWSLMDSVFLGGILSISSTTIILRAFDELGVKNKRFAQLVFGVLIIEDLVAVVLLVVLSTIAVSRQFAGTEMVMSVLKLSFFLLLWFVAGIFFLPSFLRRIQKLLSDETLLIISVGLCLFMVILASLAGFSPALGAFIMGSILAETRQAERIERIVKPVKDLFGAVFFVSVGMMINPQEMVEYRWPILIVTVLTLFGKLFSTTLGALLSGQPLKQSVQVGMS
ncbi:MAG: cation:proton antiporter, partial [Sphingobacteriales bacterium]